MKIWGKQLTSENESHFINLFQLIKLREQLLIDRTTYLISWFEVEKQRLKFKGYLAQILKIKQQQKRLVIKMKRERHYLRGLLCVNKQNNIFDPVKSLKMLLSQSISRTDQSYFDSKLYKFYTAHEKLMVLKINLHNLCPQLNPCGMILVINQLKRYHEKNEFSMVGYFDVVDINENKFNLKGHYKIWNVFRFKPMEFIGTFLKLFKLPAIRKFDCEDFTLLNSLIKRKFHKKGGKHSARENILASSINKMIKYTESSSKVSIPEILNSTISSLLSTITLLGFKLYQLVVSSDYLISYNRLIMELTSQIIMEHRVIAGKEPIDLLSPLTLNNILNSLQCRYCILQKSEQERFSMNKMKLSDSGTRWNNKSHICQNNIENNMINEICIGDKNCQSYQSKEAELLKLMINDIIIQYIREIFKCVLIKNF